MCGIAGIVDLAGERPMPPGTLQAMAGALVHRGPDEDGTVAVVFNGELFDYPELRPQLEARGHRFATHCDTELIPHLWEDHGEKMLEHLRGQFALALWDQRRRRLLLARDRFGICPLFWTRRTTPAGDWLLF